MTYREAHLCAFCERSSDGVRCARCTVEVCPAHGAIAADPHCAACAKELADDLEIARFGVAVNVAPPDSGSLFAARRDDPFAQVASAAVRAVRTFFAERRARRVFAARSPEEIAAWRRRAGVTTR